MHIGLLGEIATELWNTRSCENRRDVSSWLGLDWQVAGVSEHRKQRMTDLASSHTHLLLPAPPAAPPPLPSSNGWEKNQCKICHGTEIVKLIWLERETISTLVKNINLRVRKKKKNLTIVGSLNR